MDGHVLVGYVEMGMLTGGYAKMMSVVSVVSWGLCFWLCFWLFFCLFFWTGAYDMFLTSLHLLCFFLPCHVSPLPCSAERCFS